jgi:hypothetical protein
MVGYGRREADLVLAPLQMLVQAQILAPMLVQERMVPSMLVQERMVPSSMLVQERMVPSPMLVQERMVPSPVLVQAPILKAAGWALCAMTSLVELPRGPLFAVVAHVKSMKAVERRAVQFELVARACPEGCVPYS